MDERSVIELRAYLRKVDPEPDAAIDSFREQVDIIFKLRIEAEKNFKNNPHIAKSKRKALPLGWPAITQILNPSTMAPPEKLITQISRECFNETDEIIRNMRKILTREREKVSLGLVQQVDPHCLRWLSKQPGYNAMEKAGAKQRILAIVRRENFNTIENRIFKDYLKRTKQEARFYLRVNGKKFPNHEAIKRVARLERLCEEGFRDPIMEGITAIQELPIPNYVLRQERRYSKIWKAYCDLIRQSDIAEKLWLRRTELAVTLEKLRLEAKVHADPRAKYHSPIWFNYLDGKHNLLEKPFYKNELMSAAHQKFLSFKRNQNKEPVFHQDNVIIDLTGKEPSRDLLIYGCHENAKPYLQDYKKPSIENIKAGEHFFLNDLLHKHDKKNSLLHSRLRDYFEQLFAHIGGKNWLILVPDDWDALWQETIIKSIPLPRNKVFLLWRSVAAVIGIISHLEDPRENDTVVIVDIQQGGIVSMSKLTLALCENGNSLIPQRKSFIRHPQSYAKIVLSVNGPIPKRDAFLYGKKSDYILSPADITVINAFAHRAKHVVIVNNSGIKIPISKWHITAGELLERGAKQFITQRDRGQIAYYDELEALSLVVQTEDERILAKPLVEADEKSPGGKEIVTKTIKRAAVLKRESDYVDLVLCMGEATPDTSLKIKRHEFNKSLIEDHAIDLSARMTPGQGMAVVTVTSDFLRKPIELDFLHGMTDKDPKGRALTMSSLENEMERSFPPDSPDVIADDLLWAGVRDQVDAYMKDLISPDGSWFAKAQRIYLDGAPLPNRISPLERLRRKNVFGNAPAHRFPSLVQGIFGLLGQQFNFEALFQKLASGYNGPDHAAVIRLIAWTYASNEPAFDHIRRQTVKHVFEYAQGATSIAPLHQEMTICANLCVSRNEWRTCLKAIEYRVKDYNNNVSRDFYLLYNLLQFHPSILKDTGYFQNDGCWKIVKHIPHWYHTHRQGTVAIGYILKSILYFLRCRRFDGKKFLTREYDPEHYAIIAECLNYSVHRSHEKLRRLVIEYLNNKGTIDGLPVD